MKILLGNRFSPITDEIGFIEAPIDFVVKKTLEWSAKWSKKKESEFSVGPAGSSLEEAFSRLLPLTMPRTKTLIIPTESYWVACFRNGFVADADSIAGSAAQLFGVRALRFAAVDHTYSRGNGGRLGYRLFELLAPVECGNPAVRTVGLYASESTWKFLEYGEPLPWENIKDYEEKRASGKFSLEMLNGLARGLGIDPFAESFYRPEAGVIIEEILGPMEKLRRKAISLEEAQTRLRL